MKIEVELNPKSIKNAIKVLKAQRKILTEQMIPEYMQRAADWIINRANEILDRSDIGEHIKVNIFRAWDTQWLSKNHLKIINHSFNSAFVEFGVGIIAQTDKHPNADKTDYEYNVPSEYKFSQGYWQFNVKGKADLDLPESAIIYEQYQANGISIITQGTKGVWYLFNAVEEFKLTYKDKLWEEIKKKYWS